MGQYVVIGEKLMNFLQGSHLLAKLTPLEIKRGIFIVGHRLEPLHSELLPPWEVELTMSDGKALPSRILPISLDDARIFFTFFGGESIVDLLVEQDEENGKALMAGTEDAIVRVRACEASTLYKEAGLAAGDYLDLEMADKEGKRFIVRPVRAAGIKPEQREAWFAAVSAAAKAAMQELKVPEHPIFFIEVLFESAPSHVLAAPAASFSEFYNTSGELEIRELAGHDFMWAAGADIPGLLLSAGFSTGDGDVDELTKSFGNLGLALDSEEVADFVCDALWRGGNIDDALARCLGSSESLGLPKAEFKAVLAATRKFAEGIAAGYDRSREDPVAAGLRASLLDLYAPFLAWMRRLGGIVQSESDLETEEFGMLTETMQNVCELIHYLGDGQVPKGLPIADFQRQLPELSARALDLMDEIEEDLGGKGPSAPTAARESGKAKAGKASAKGGSREKKKPRPAAEKTYLFEARIADIEPPIRRLISVPGNRNLAELHEILQRAFGWDDCHLHLFRFRKEVYGLPSPDDFEPVLDERQVRLDELSLRTRSRIEYVYDFGDGWEHELVVVATRKALPGGDAGPICLEAERACPLEDCGGIPGYMSLIEALAKPGGRTRGG
jgi:hypothetical protein